MRSLPCSSWKHPHTPLSACDCVWPPSALKSPASAPPMSCGRVASVWARQGAHGTDQGGGLRCRLVCDHALQRQQVGAGCSGAMSATAKAEQCSVDEVVADGMSDVVTCTLTLVPAENRAAELKHKVQPGKTLRHHGFPRDSSTQYWCGPT